MRGHRPQQPGTIRVQTGVRMERRLVKVLKALAELRDVPLGGLLEALVLDAFAGRVPLDAAGLAKVRDLMAIYELVPPAPGAPTPEGE